MDNQTLEHVIALEKSLLRDDVIASQSQVDALLHDEFIEYSQSGLSYGKDAVLANCEGYTPSATPREAYGFSARFLSDDLVQVLFETASVPKTQQTKRKALRSSLWKREGEQWQMIFHQGTLKADEA